MDLMELIHGCWPYISSMKFMEEENIYIEDYICEKIILIIYCVLPSAILDIEQGNIAETLEEIIPKFMRGNSIIHVTYMEKLEPISQTFGTKETRMIILKNLAGKKLSDFVEEEYRVDIYHKDFGTEVLVPFCLYFRVTYIHIGFKAAVSKKKVQPSDAAFKSCQGKANMKLDNHGSDDRLASKSILQKASSNSLLRVVRTLAMMMRIDCVSHITNTALLPCLYNGTVLRRRSLSLRNSCFRQRKFQLRCVSASSDSLQFDFSPPPIDHDLLDTISVAGGKVSEDGIVESFDNDDEALDAFDNDVVVVDLSHFGRIRVSGDDRAHFLHNQTTANFESLSEGQGCDTVFVTPTARTIDIAHAWIMKNAILLTVSPTTCQSIIEMLNKYIFFADKVEIKDITKQTCLFALAGPKSNQIMSKLNLGDLIGQPYGKHQHYSFDGMPITVGVGSLISDEGFTMLMSPGGAVSVWKTLLAEGAIPMGSVAWEKLRITQGRPAPERELSKEYNVLEAGLWNSISLNKGCYKGQETIARLMTYDGIKQRLCGLNLSAPAEPGSPIIVDGKKVGKLTSYTRGRDGSGHFGLGYIKKQAASIGNTVTIGEDISGIVSEVPYLARQHPPSANSSS